MRTAGCEDQAYPATVSARTIWITSTRCLPSRFTSNARSDSSKSEYGVNVCIGAHPAHGGWHRGHAYVARPSIVPITLGVAESQEGLCPYTRRWPAPAAVPVPGPPPQLRLWDGGPVPGFDGDPPAVVDRRAHHRLQPRPHSRL